MHAVLGAAADHAIVVEQRLAHLSIHGEKRLPSLGAWQTISITLLSGTSTGRLVSMCGHTGVMQMAATAGNTIGPPAESEYAVEPVGVAMISPSALNVLTILRIHVRLQIDHARDLGFAR